MLQLFSQTYAKQTQFSNDTVFFIFKMLNLLLTAICIIEELKKYPFYKSFTFPFLYIKENYLQSCLLTLELLGQSGKIWDFSQFFLE